MSLLLFLNKEYLEKLYLYFDHGSVCTVFIVVGVYLYDIYF